MASTHAHHVLQLLLRRPLRIEETQRYLAVALEAGIENDLTVYDAFYLVLADVLSATLVTADWRLAEAAARAELIV